MIKHPKEGNEKGKPKGVQAEENRGKSEEG